MINPITLYYNSNQPESQAVKNYLDKIRHQYQPVDLFNFPEKSKEVLLKTGQEKIPVVIVQKICQDKNFFEILIGYDLNKLNKVLNQSTI